MSNILPLVISYVEQMTASTDKTTRQITHTHEYVAEWESPSVAKKNEKNRITKWKQ